MILTMKKVLTILVAMLSAGNSLSQDLSFSYDGNGHFSFSDSLKNIRARIRGNRPDVYLDNEDATLSFNSQGMAGILGKAGMTLTFGKIRTILALSGACSYICLTGKIYFPS